MKVFNFIRTLFVIITVNTLFAQSAVADVAINASNFPDANFRAWLQAQAYGSDNLITNAEIANIKMIDVRSKNIISIKGIEYFTALLQLYCSSNQITILNVSKNIALTILACDNNPLTTLDVSKNTELTYLHCSSNQLTALDVSKNTKLTYLDCGGNQLTFLDISKNTALEFLSFSSNQLTTLDISKNIALATLYCNYNQLTALDISNNTALVRLSCSNNQLTALDVSKNTELTNLRCSHNQLTTLDVSNNTKLSDLSCFYNQLSSLDISKNTALTRLSCDNNSLTILDVSENTALEFLYCDFNQLTTLDVLKNTELTTLWCEGNQLTIFDVSKNTALTYLNCQHNQLCSLDVSKNTELTTLWCGVNQLTSLDVSENTKLTFLNCTGNQLTTLDVSKNTELTYLSCDGNQLFSLDVSKNTELTDLNCGINQLISLDISKNTKLTKFTGYMQNPLTIPLSGCGSNYSATIDLDNTTTFGNAGISYAAGKLTSNNENISQTSFSAKTGLNAFTISGTLRFAYETTCKDVYVKVNGAGTGSGSSWENAMSSDAFAEKLPNVADGTTFHIAEGIYKPTYSTNIDWGILFETNSAVILIGGYRSDITDETEQPNPTEYETIFSGDMLDNDIVPKGYDGSLNFAGMEDNRRYILNARKAIVLENIIFQGATEVALHFNAATDYYAHINHYVNNCVFRNNNSTVIEQEGGKFINVFISNSHFYQNNAVNIVYQYSAAGNMSIEKSIFNDNQARQGIVSFVSYIPADSLEHYRKISNTTFTNNRVEENVINYGVVCSLYNNTFINNNANSTFAFWSNYGNKIQSSKNEVVGNIFMDNVSKTYYDQGISLVNPKSHYNLYLSTEENADYVSDTDLFITKEDIHSILEGSWNGTVFIPNLKDNGGFTPTVALKNTLLPNGKAINSLPTSISGVSTDQRGVPRNTEAACIGAYEIGCGLPQTTELSIATNATLCRGEVLTLNIAGIPANQTGIFKYTWSFGGNESDIEIVEVKADTIHIRVLAKIPTLQVSATVTDVCGNDITIDDELTISGIATVSFSGIEEGALYCKEAAPLPLTGTPEGGTFKINGIIAANNEFSPSTITGNEAVIRYEVLDAQSGCFNYDEKTVALSQAVPGLSLKIELAEPVKEILCYGEKASITFNITGGNGDYLYSVNEAIPVAAGTAAVTLPALNAGTYSIKAWQANDKCAGTTSYSATFTEAQALSVATSMNGKLCINANVIASITGATKPYSYTWTKPNGDVVSSSTSSNSIAMEVAEFGEYAIQVTDALECTIETSSTTVSQPAALPALTFGSVQTKDETCFGANNGTASVSFSGNTGGEAVLIEVKNSQNALVKSQHFTTTTGILNLTDLLPDTYQVFMRYGTENCTLLGGSVEQTSFTITKMEEHTAFKNLTTANVTCLQEPNGSFGIQVTGWAPTHEALLNGNQISPKSIAAQIAFFDTTGLIKGNYVLTITDECGTAIEESITITGDLLSASDLSITNAKQLCRGEVLTLNIAGIPANQTSNYQYTWSFGENESNVEQIETTADTIRLKVNAKIATLQVSATLTDECGNDVTIDNEFSMGGTGTVSFSGIEEGALYCKEAAPLPLTGTPEGGTFKINGIIAANNEFAPSTITGHEAVIRYEVLDAQSGCFNYTEKTVALSQADPGLSLKIELAEPVKEILCYGEKASIKFNITGGNGDYFYSINKATPVAAGTAAIELSPLNAGTYRIEAWQASNKCDAAPAQTFTFTEPQQLAVSTAMNGKLCINANVIASITGATKPYSYTWTKSNGDVVSSSTSSNSIVMEVAELGEYAIQVTDAHECSIKTSTATVSQPAALPVLTFGSLQKKDESCFEGNNGTANIPFSNNTRREAVFIEVKNSQDERIKSQQFTTTTGTMLLTNLTPGTYQVFMRYGAENCTLLGGDVSQTSFTIDKMEEPIAFKDTTTTELTCLNEANGSFNFQVAGWANTHTALFSGKQVSPDSTVGQTAFFGVKNLNKGSYTLKVEDACKNSAATNTHITGIEPYRLNTNSSSGNLLCNAAANGHIELEITGGNRNAAHFYMIGEKERQPITEDTTNVIFSDLTAGAYRFRYESVVNACSDYVELLHIIEEPAPLQVQHHLSGMLCSGNAAIVLTATGATAPYGYEWITPGNETIATEENTLEVSSVGTYTYKVNDSFDCPFIAGTIEIQTLKLDSTTVKDETCYIDNNEDLTVFYSGNSFREPVVVEIFDTNEKIVSKATANSESGELRISLLAPGNYKLLLRYNSENCALNENVLEKDFAIAEMETTEPHAPISFGTSQVTDLSCLNEPNGAIAITVNGWVNQHTAILNGVAKRPQSVTDDIATFVFENLKAGDYHLVVANECGNDAQDTLLTVEGIEPYRIELISSYDQLECSNHTTGSLEFKITGGNKNTNRFYLEGEEGVNLPTDTTVVIENLPRGSYRYYYGSSDNDCFDAVSVLHEIEAPAPLQVTTNFTGKFCDNATIELIATGETAPYTYEWLTPGNETISTEDGVLAVDTIGSYKYRVEDMLGCSFVENTLQIGNLSITGKNVKDETCYNGNNGAVTIWYAGNPFREFVIIEVFDETKTIVSKATGSAVSGTLTAEPLAPGNYTATLRYENTDCAAKTGGDPEVNTISFTVAPMLNPISIRNIKTVELTCLKEPNGSFSATVGGWARTHQALLDNYIPVEQRAIASGQQTASFNIKGLRKGEHKLTITDECGNSEEETISITGIDPYKLVITDSLDRLNCSYSNNGFLRVKAVDGYPEKGIVYMMGKEDNITEATASSTLYDTLRGGMYQIMYKTTLGGCTDNVVLNKAIQAPLPVKFEIDTMDVSCYGLKDGEISLQAYQGSMPRDTATSMRGLPGYTYTWEKVDDANYGFTPQTIPLEKFWKSHYGDTIYNGVVGMEKLPVGTYLCKVTIPAAVDRDSLCYYQTDSIPIINPLYDSLQVTGFTFNETEANCKIANRRIEVEAKGGWKGYIFSIMTDEEFAELDAINNEEEEGEDEDIGTSGGQMDFEDDSEITYLPDNKAKYRSYIIQPTTFPTTYHVLVSDSLGCRAKEIPSFTINPTVKLDTIKVDSIRCPGATDGKVELLASRSDGSASSFTYKIWYSEDNIESLNNNIAKDLAKGFYSFLAIENNNQQCEGFISAEIKDSKLPYSLMQNKITDIKCFGESNGEIQVLVAGGSKPYTFKLNNTEVEATEDGVFLNISGIGTGSSHKLSVYDKAECVKELEFAIKQPDRLQIGNVEGTAICPGSNAGRLIAKNVTGGTAPYSYSLDGAKYEKTASIKAGIGKHPVYVKDANECIAESEGEVLSKSGEANPPEIDFFVSTWGYSSDVLAVINTSVNKTASIDSTVYTFGENDTLLYVIRDTAGIYAFKGDEFNDIDTSKIQFIGVKNTITDDYKPLSDSVLLSFKLKMTVYYSDGCDYEKESEVFIAPDEHEIYPEGKLLKKQPDIIKVYVYPNPTNGREDYNLTIEFANKVNFRVQAFSMTGNLLEGADKTFKADEIKADGTVVLSKQKLGITGNKQVILRVTTLTDTASIIVE